MNGMLADIIGLIGSALFVGGFAYANWSKHLNKLLFNVFNLVGAILLLISLSVKFNLAAFVLEAVWGVLALAGIIGELRKRGTKP